MVATENIQTRFLSEVKKGLHPSLSFVDELAEMLSISRDSAYRRIRGETTMALEEIKLICNRYRISVDGLLTPAASMVSFHHRSVGMDGFTFFDWLKCIDDQITLLGHSSGGSIEYLAKDIPVFHCFGSPVLAAYKIYFWLKTYLGIDFQDQQFSTTLIPKEYVSLAGKIADKYARLDTTEIWGDEAVSSTLRQVEYHFQCGAFTSVDDALLVLEEYQGLIERVKGHAVSGTKGEGRGGLRLYKNELMLGDNTLYLRLGNGRATMLQHAPFEWLSTENESYCRETERRIANTITRSELISKTGERERNVFFNQMISRIAQSRERIRLSATRIEDTNL